MNKIVSQVLMAMNAEKDSNGFPHWRVKLTSQFYINEAAANSFSPDDMRLRLVDMRENLLKKLDECIALTYREE